MATLTIRKIGEALNGDVYDVAFEAQAFRAKDNPLPNAPVTFRVTRVGQPVEVFNETTDGQGIASLALQLDPGTYTVSAVLVHDGTTSRIPQFALKARPAPVPARIERETMSGSGRTRTFVYAVFDERGNALGGIELTSTVPVMFGGARTQRVTTDASGRTEIQATIPRGTDELMFRLFHAGSNTQHIELLML